jgi:hypothetical protein
LCILTLMHDLFIANLVEFVIINKQRQYLLAVKYIFLINLIIDLFSSRNRVFFTDNSFNSMLELCVVQNKHYYFDHCKNDHND